LMRSLEEFYSRVRVSRKPSDILYHELIGLRVEVESSPDPDQVGLSGVVVDETSGLLVVETSLGPRMVPKSHRVFLFTLPSGRRVRVVGDRLVGRPEERVKRI